MVQISEIPQRKLLPHAARMRLVYFHAAHFNHPLEWNYIRFFVYFPIMDKGILFPLFK